MIALCLWLSCAAGQDAGPKPLASFAVKRKEATLARVGWMAFTPGGALAVRYADTPGDPWFGPGDATLGVFDPATGKAVASAAIKGGDTGTGRAACAVGPGGAWVAYPEDGELKFLALPPGKPVLPGGGTVKVRPLRPDTSVWVGPKGETAFMCNCDTELLSTTLREWTFAKESYRDLVRPDSAGGATGVFALDPATRQFAVALREDNADRRIDNWSLGEKPAKVSIPTKWGAQSLAHSPDGKVLAAGFGDGSAAWYDAATGKALHVPRLGQFTVGSVAFHPGGKHLAFGTFDGRGAANLFLFDVASGAVVAKLAADPNGVSAVCFDASGDRLAVCGSSGTVTVWDAAALLKLRRD